MTKELLRWNEDHHSQRTFSCQKLSQTWKCAFKDIFRFYTPHFIHIQKGKVLAVIVKRCKCLYDLSLLFFERFTWPTLFGASFFSFFPSIYWNISNNYFLFNMQFYFVVLWKIVLAYYRCEGHLPDKFSSL